MYRNWLFILRITKAENAKHDALNLYRIVSNFLVFLNWSWAVDKIVWTSFLESCISIQLMTFQVAQNNRKSLWKSKQPKTNETSEEITDILRVSLENII